MALELNLSHSEVFKRKQSPRLLDGLPGSLQNDWAYLVWGPVDNETEDHPEFR